MTAMPKDLFNRDGAIFMGARRDPCLLYTSDAADE